MNSEIVKMKVKDFVHGDSAVSSDDGENLFTELSTTLKTGSIIELDFSEISIITTAFLNSAIGQLYSLYTGEQLNNFLKLKNVANEDEILFKKVIDRAKEYFANKKGFEDSANSAMYDS